MIWGPSTRYAISAGVIGVTLLALLLAMRDPPDASDSPEGSEDPPVTAAVEATPTATPTATPRFATPLPTPNPPAWGWHPALQTSWQLQFTGRIDFTVPVEMIDVELFDTSATTVAAIHARGRRAVCYFSAGSWEDWRPDANRFPNSVKGKSNGWPGELWLDVRRLDVLMPIIESRLDACRQKGFDGADPDNMDGYLADSGFPLTYEDQLRFNIAVANAARARGLSVGLKNDMRQIGDLLPYFDWTLNEQCFEYNECELLVPFVEAGKPVFNVEYRLRPEQFCARANALNFNSLHKRLELDAYRHACR